MFQKVASKFFRTQQNATRPFKLYRVFNIPSIFFQLVPTNRWFFYLRTVSFLQLLSFITPSTAPTTTLPTTVVHFAAVEEFCHSRTAAAIPRPAIKKTQKSGEPVLGSPDCLFTCLLLPSSCVPDVLFLPGSAAGTRGEYRPRCRSLPLPLP